MSIFYQPADGFVGDVIPFYWKRKYHAFYLKAPLPPLRNEAYHTVYAHLVSSDLLHWDEWPIAIQPGSESSPDSVSCWTGSVIENGGTFHLFYTGYSGERRPQVICHATSSDLCNWKKDSGNPILIADPQWYEPFDWRDPFVFWNAQDKEFWMLLAARIKEGPINRRGCIALAVSRDLDHWEIRSPFWSPNLFYTHECPDLFYWHNIWVLIFSEFSESKQTHYRISNSLEGPWVAPSNDTFDTNSFYAARTASSGRRRFIFGWNPTHEGDTDAGKLQWGGNMVIHELYPPKDHTIPVRAVPKIMSAIQEPRPISIEPRIGKWDIGRYSLTGEAPSGFAAAMLGEMQDPCRIDLTIACNIDTIACGILLRTNDCLESYYQLRWEPRWQRIVYDRWPRPGDQPFMVERSIGPSPGGLVHLSIILDGTMILTYVNDTFAMSHRAYDHKTGQIGLFVIEGTAHFSHIQMKGIKSL